MTLGKIIPERAKPYARRILRAIKDLQGLYLSRRSRIHAYWRRPWDAGNAPSAALTSQEGHLWSKFLVQIAKRYAQSDFRILEIGCGAGRNLNYLCSGGFSRLAGIEISEDAVRLLRKSYPDMAVRAEIYNSSIEEIVRRLGSNTFDIVYTMAVLQHIHPASEWVFREIVRIASRFLITIENEKVKSWRHFPRNYKVVFESLGMEQVEELHWSDLDGESTSYYGRVFKKL